MGINWAKLQRHPVHIVLLGLDAAGKTTVLYRLKFDEFAPTLPTIGFNCEKVRGTLGTARGVSFMIWDVGGQDRVRPLWRSYTRAADGMVFVVDSADEERLEEARVELARVARTREATGVPLLVIANKQDLPRARSAVDVERLLGVPELRRGTTAVPGALSGRSCCVRPACAISGDGVDDALAQLYQMIRDKRKADKHRHAKLRKR